MKIKNPNPDTRAGRSSESRADPGFGVAASDVNRREFLYVGLTGAALLTLTGCATFRGSKSDLDQATTDLRETCLTGSKGTAPDRPVSLPSATGSRTAVERSSS